MSDTSCTRQTLAQASHCKVELCDCGVLHLTVGPVTFRTTPDMTESFLATLSEAVQVMALRNAHAPLATPGSEAVAWPAARKAGGVS
jgi:hypothetical protein